MWNIKLFSFCQIHLSLDSLSGKGIGQKGSLDGGIWYSMVEYGFPRWEIPLIEIVNSLRGISHRGQQHSTMEYHIPLSKDPFCPIPFQDSQKCITKWIVKLLFFTSAPCAIWSWKPCALRWGGSKSLSNKTFIKSSCSSQGWAKLNVFSGRQPWAVSSSCKRPQDKILARCRRNLARNLARSW